MRKVSKETQILRISGSSHTKNKAQEEKYLAKLDEIIDSGAPVSDDKNAGIWSFFKNSN